MLLHARARPLLVVVSLLGLVACAGGQTGEITELGACESVRALSGLEALDATERAQLDAALAPWRGPFTWERDGREPTTLTVAAAMRDGDVVEVGQGGCARVRVPVTLTMTTDDGLLDVALPADVELHAVGVSAIRARVPLAAIEGRLDLGWSGPATDAALYIELDREGPRSTGQLFVDPSVDEDEVRVASW